MEKSLKQIIYETNVLVNAHIQLRSFYYGDLLDIIKIGRIDYASCFLSINSASNNANFETFNLELFVFDILAADDSNRTDIENTTKRILNDLITTIRYSTRWNDFSEVLNDVNELKYYDKLGDRLSGWGATIQLKVYRNDCLVGLPIDGYDFDMGGNFEATVLAIVKNTDNDILATKLVSDSDDTIIVPNITITDSDGTEIDYPSGVNFTCTAGGGSGDVEVNGVVYGQYTAPNNFDVLVYNRAVAGSLVGSLGTGRWVIGQSPIQVNTTPLDFVSAEATYNLNVLDQNSNPIGSASGTNWLVPIYNTANLTKTGQTTSYAANDDGDLQRGRDTDFFTLAENNPFGNDDRFTDTLGGQTYANNIIIDWSQWNQRTNTVNGYAISSNSSTSGTQTWANWMANSPYTIGVFSGWVLANFLEMAAVCNIESGNNLNYAPFNSGGQTLFTSSTRKADTNQAHLILNTGSMSFGNKSANIRALLVRTFTLAELGL
jgi:hypothetical protein